MGCMKDVIIINGINYYSYVIEFVVEELLVIEIFYIVVCVVCVDQNLIDQLVIFFVVFVKMNDEQMFQFFRNI